MSFMTDPAIFDISAQPATLRRPSVLILCGKGRAGGLAA